MFRKRLFKAISAGLLAPDISQFSEILDPDSMLDLWHFDVYHESCGAVFRRLRPLIFAENPQSFGDRLV